MTKATALIPLFVLMFTLAAVTASVLSTNQKQQSNIITNLTVTDDAGNQITSIDWGIIAPNTTVTRPLKIVSNAQNIQITTANATPKGIGDYLALTYSDETLFLTVAPNAPEGDFSFDIKIEAF